MHKLPLINKTSVAKLIYPILSIIVILSSWFQLELTLGYTSKSNIFRNDLKYIMLNVFTLFVIYSVMLIVSNSALFTNIAYSFLFGLLSVVNYYTILLHGSPFTIFEFGNITTAAKYVSMYNIDIDRYVILIICLTIINIVLNISLKKFHHKAKLKPALIRAAVLFVLGNLIIYYGYFSASPIKPKKTIDWTWKNSYQKYGYVACSIETITQYFNKVTIPTGYNEAIINSIEIVNDNNSANNRPDIILILNESFYDLDLITDTQSDIDYLENINTMSNAVRGYAVVPLAGGGTNNSEFELLTSNSSYLLPNITPFNVFSMKNENTIVSYLDSLDYTTLAAHPAAANNYNRNRAYPNMGFDNVYFRESFNDIAFYDQRDIATDECAFNNIINWYENNNDNNPQFIYLLTIQNHGGYDTNPPSSALVHISKNYGEYTHSINEYLSCIHLTDIAFKKLTDYYSQVDRDVIVCMVGDHAPWFAEFIADDNLSDDDKKKLLRSTPYIIWANFEISDSLPEFLSLNYIVPSLIDIAGIEQSTYYSYMNSIKDDYPIVSSYGKYYDSQYALHNYGDISNDTAKINQYFYMEYNNLSSNKRTELFVP